MIMPKLITLVISLGIIYSSISIVDVNTYCVHKRKMKLGYLSMRLYEHILYE